MRLNTKAFHQQKTPLIEAINKFGNSNRFAKALGISRQVVDGWLHKCKLSPPVNYCKKIEAITCGEITRAQLRPDIFGDIVHEELTDKQKLETCLFILNGIADKFDNKEGK